MFRFDSFLVPALERVSPINCGNWKSGGSSAELRPRITANPLRTNSNFNSDHADTSLPSPPCSDLQRTLH